MMSCCNPKPWGLGFIKANEKECRKTPIDVLKREISTLNVELQMAIIEGFDAPIP